MLQRQHQHGAENGNCIENGSVDIGMDGFHGNATLNEVLP